MLNLKNGTDFTISSHNAYLNSEIIISSILDYDKHKDLPEWSHCIKDISTNKLYEIKDTPIRTFLTAGHHRFVSCNTEKKQCIDVFIHDAMKFGGSKLKQGFIYDDNPWIFVEMNDRLYI